MPKNLKRFNGRGDLHFLTFSCYRRLPLLGTAGARDLFVHALERIRARYSFRVVGYVVMPEHVHLLINEPPMRSPSTILKVLKQVVARDLREGNSDLRTGHSRSARGKAPKELPRFWQPRFYDFNVYSAGKKKEKLEYMHANPITRGLVPHPQDWRWSSFSFYAKGERGLVTIDPGN
jgi:putative transposase